jgi:SAM-dependent methyltransferase
MRNVFGGRDRSTSVRLAAERTPRNSSGWTELLKHLRSGESLRILDIGPTSSTNINFVTSLGHSIYMANLVEEAAKAEWMVASAEGGPPVFNVDGFLSANLNFSGRTFDVVIFWDTADFVPGVLLPPLFERLHQVLQPGGLLMAFFHSKATGAETGFFRYHLTGTGVVDMQSGGNYPLRGVYNNRQIENLLHDFRGFRFFLAKDNLREVIATR